MQPPIPPDALERISPIINALQEQLKPLFEQLPDGSDYATQFHVPEDAA
jgi:hypothetical protein